MRFEPKDPNAVLDYAFDWAAWLAGDTIANSAWTVTGGGVSVSSASNTTTTATVFLSGGIEGSEATISNRITTAGGRTQDKTAVVPIASR